MPNLGGLTYPCYLPTFWSRSRHGIGKLPKCREVRKYERPGLKQDEIEEIKEAFDLFDTDQFDAYHSDSPLS